MSGFVELPLHRIAHGRAGDKGDRLNISVIAYDAAHYPLIRDQVTVERVAELFAHRRPGHIERFELPRLWALNFVIDDVLEGGVNDALNLDGHGKTHSFLLLSMMLRVPRDGLPAGLAAFSTPDASHVSSNPHEGAGS
ncbi:MAG: hypothetical protein M9951_19205 [Burkholderiaceae bacterium]|jgi:hypothetical protein|nr:hypothetical protein [Burkholderiaceae bacterium]MEB2317191.1 hypothetical protein [Pseudomonadota bacterium]